MVLSQVALGEVSRVFPYHLVRVRPCSLVLCSPGSATQTGRYTGQACSMSFLEEFFSETGLPAVPFLGTQGFGGSFLLRGWLFRGCGKRSVAL